MIKLSVIMSEYNTPIQHFEQAIDSILNQTFTEFEFLIVDDSNDQHLEKYLEKYSDSRIKIIKNGKNIGFVSSLNKAIDAAQSDYLIRMDTDDISHHERFEILFNEITKHPEYSVIGTSMIEFDKSGKQEEFILNLEHDKQAFLQRKIPVHSSTIMRKKDILDVGKYQDYKRAEDLVLWAELLLKDYKIKSIPLILYRYRVSEQDLNKRKLKYRRDEIKARFKYYRLMGASPIQMLSILKSVIAGILPNRVMYLYHKNIRKKEI